jgi:hypothetical protein
MSLRSRELLTGLATGPRLCLDQARFDHSCHFLPKRNGDNTVGKQGVRMALVFLQVLPGTSWSRSSCTGAYGQKVSRTSPRIGPRCSSSVAVCADQRAIAEFGHQHPKTNKGNESTIVFQTGVKSRVHAD